MIEVTKTNECKSQNLSDKSGWSALATINTFDRGKSESHKWQKENALVSKKRATCTTSSLLVESLIDQLCKVYEKDPLYQKRLYKLMCRKLYEMKLIDKTYELEEYQFLRSYYQNSFYRLLRVSHSPTIDAKLETLFKQFPGFPPVSLFSSASLFDLSRYQNDFDEIDFIARGGFGQVFRVRNKVDGCEYAIKKIFFRFRSKKQCLQSLGEVRTLASLDHPNIVAYKAAWFEPFTGVVGEGGSSGSSSPKFSPEFGASEPESSVSEQESRYEEDDSGNIVFIDKTEETSEKLENFPVRSYHRKRLRYSLKSTSLCDHDSKSSNKGCRGRKLVRPDCSFEYAVLHIQMQLCKGNLREWLDSRNKDLLPKNLETFTLDSDSDLSTEIKQSNQLQLDSESISIALHIFQKILNGVEYVHTVGIIHHDLKPSNIFMEGYEYCSSSVEGKGEPVEEGAESLLRILEKNPRSQVRVGDFGLACHLSHRMNSDAENYDVKDQTLSVIPTHMLNNVNCLVQMGNHSLNGGEEKEVIGTKLYAAPEQLQGQCNIKSDMYSLGIILFELLYPFFTCMERNKVLSALRKGTIPTNFELQYPDLVPVIKTLLSQNPSSRPSIKDLIQIIKQILKEGKKLSDDLQVDTCLNKQSSLQEITLIQETKTEEFTRVSHFREQRHEIEELHEISSDVFEASSVGYHLLPDNCDRPSCLVIREDLERTISKLMEENSKKDEIIMKLKNQISELQNSFIVTDNL